MRQAVTKSSRQNSDPANLVFAGLLAFALLFAQWAGLNHRIAHGDRYQVLASCNADSEPVAGNGCTVAASHSCLLFDAATLTAALKTAVAQVPALATANATRPEPALLSWHPPFSPHFSSRAPPSV